MTQEATCHKTIDDATCRDLLAKAKEVANNAYCPYSDYAVGAALLTKDGRIFTGCNVELICYEGSICAERNAMSTAIAAGSKEFTAIAVYCKKSFEVWPCGICRQFLAEMGMDLIVIAPTENGGMKKLTMPELLPYTFADKKVK